MGLAPWCFAFTVFSVVLAQTPLQTAAPLDNTFVNTTYFDLVLDFTTVSDFTGTNQSEWKFLQRLCGLQLIYRDYYGQYPTNRRPPPVLGNGSSAIRCIVSAAGSIATPAVSVVLSQRGHPVLPYADDRYIVSIRFSGTAQALATFTASILNSQRDPMLALGVSGIGAAYAPSDIYNSLGEVWLVYDVQASLSIAWHIIIVAFFALVLLVIGAFYFRASAALGLSASKDPEPDTADEELQPGAAPRWQEQDLTAEKDRLMEQALEFTRRSASPRARSDSVSSHSRSRDYLPATERETLGKWSAQAFDDAMALEPALNLPPESAVVRSSREAAKHRPKPKRRRQASPAGAEGEMPLLSLPADATELPPEAEDLESARRTVRYVPPMGLAARRLAAAMTTLALQPPPHHLKHGTMGLMKGSLIAPSRRRYEQEAGQAKPRDPAAGSVPQSPNRDGDEDTDPEDDAEYIDSLVPAEGGAERASPNHQMPDDSFL